jgi:hypothetical protein
MRRFELINSQNLFHNDTQKKIQQLLYYAESRFWCILKSTKKENDIWCQKLLHRELVIMNGINIVVSLTILQIFSSSCYRTLASG